MRDSNDPVPEVPVSQRETIDLDAPAKPSGNRWSWLIDRNPLFLISGVCMLAGCFLVSGVIHGYDPAEVGEGPLLLMLIALLAVLNVYEVTVIWLGLRLSRSRTLVRDTRHLLALALLLVVDASFVYNETSIFEPKVGAVIAGLAALLAIGKVWWIVRGLRIVPSRGAAVVTIGTLALLYTLPVLVRTIAHDGFLSQPMAMLVWGVLGVAVGAYALPLHWVTFTNSEGGERYHLQRLVAGGLILLPIASLIGHAAALLWIYESRFELVMLSPLMLGLALVILRQQHRLGGPAASAKASAIIVACAIVPALLPTESLTWVSGDFTWLAVSPLRGILVAASCVLAWAWWIGGRGIVAGVIAASPLTAASLGHRPWSMIEHARWLLDSASGWLPRTQLQWGASAIAMAFVCLAIGSLMSWRRLGRADADDRPGNSDQALASAASTTGSRPTE
jgi:hypothetical protein